MHSRKIPCYLRKNQQISRRNSRQSPGRSIKHTRVRWFEMSHMFGGLLEAGQRGNTDNFGKEGMHEESDSWKEKQHTCIHERPNDCRVRVFSI
jgi:hypothetical protein